MRFWQAVVIAQLSAGSVWADRFEDFWPHTVAETFAVIVGAVLWWLFSALFGPATFEAAGPPDECSDKGLDNG